MCNIRRCGLCPSECPSECTQMHPRRVRPSGDSLAWLVRTSVIHVHIACSWRWALHELFFENVSLLFVLFGMHRR